MDQWEAFGNTETASLEPDGNSCIPKCSVLASCLTVVAAHHPSFSCQRLMVCISFPAEYKVDWHRKEEILKPEWNLIVWELSWKQNICYDSSTFPSKPYGERFAFHVSHKHQFNFFFFLLGQITFTAAMATFWAGNSHWPQKTKSNPLLSLHGETFFFFPSTF